MILSITIGLNYNVCNANILFYKRSNHTVNLPIVLPKEPYAEYVIYLKMSHF